MPRAAMEKRRVWMKCMVENWGNAVLTISENK